MKALEFETFIHNKLIQASFSFSYPENVKLRNLNILSSGK